MNVVFMYDNIADEVYLIVILKSLKTNTLVFQLQESFEFALKQNA